MIGGLLGLHKSLIQRRTLALALGFAAGAMLLVSFLEMLPAAQSSIAEQFGSRAFAITLGVFFAGIAIVAIIDRLLPDAINPAERGGMEDQKNDGLSASDVKRLRRSGLLMAIAIGLHNFPEGLVTFVGAMQDPQLGIVLAVAIAIHNIPEGIAVAAPIYAATKNRRKAFGYAALSGLAEPVGALVGYLLLATMLPEGLIGLLFAAVAGMMVFISLHELLPAAMRYATTKHQTIYGTVGGMGVMTLSLVLLQVS